VADLETQQVREMGRTQGWQICPGCRSLVEKREGCVHMTCRCRVQVSHNAFSRHISLRLNVSRSLIKFSSATGVGVSGIYVGGPTVILGHVGFRNF